MPDDLPSAPRQAVRFVADQLPAAPVDLEAYGVRVRTRQQHLQHVMRHLRFRRPTPMDLDLVGAWLLERALEHDRPALLFEQACEKLRRDHLLRPGVMVLERLVVRARMEAHAESLRRLGSLLTEDVRALLDALLIPEPETGRTKLACGVSPFSRETRRTGSTPDLLRVAGSLKRGYVTASLLVSKLQAYPRQNRLTRVLQEYGRLVKTIFVLRYYESEAYRRRIHTQLNKGEALNDLQRFLFFGGDGKIRRKQEEALADQALCLSVIANADIVWNTVYMQAVTDALREEGYEVKDLAQLSPVRFQHINRYGKYRFDVEAAAKRRGL